MDPLQLVQNSFQHFGVEAVFDPEGVNETIFLIPVRGDQVASFGGLDIAAPGTLYEVMRQDWERLNLENPEFIVDGDRRKVKATPQAKDARRHVLILDSKKVEKS